jgi:D-alanyl-D-alanine carboxypeptidase
MLNLRFGSVVFTAVIMLTGCANPSSLTSQTPTPQLPSIAKETRTPTPSAAIDSPPTPQYDSLSDPSSYAVVVNKKRPLNPLNFVPSDLVQPNLPNNNGQPVRATVAAFLEKMAQEASQSGIQLRLASAYRSYDLQTNTYNNFVARDGQAIADTYSARPGHSEHQTGLAVDLDDGQGCSIDYCFAEKPGGIWLAENAWRYGFILRYPSGAEAITGYTFEPWHYRFVGVHTATQMHNAGTLTLEQHFGLPPAPTYKAHL